MVYLKQVLALIFSAIAFFSVLIQMNSHCHNKAVISVTEVEKQTHISENITTAEMTHEEPNDDFGCKHNPSQCHNCHFGHCAFTLASLIQVSVYNAEPNLYFNHTSFVIYNFQTGPFRPPII